MNRTPKYFPPLNPVIAELLDNSRDDLRQAIGNSIFNYACDIGKSLSIEELNVLVDKIISMLEEKTINELIWGDILLQIENK